MLIPLDKKDSTKNQIIEVLSSLRPSSLRLIAAEIKRKYGKNITAQAVFKSLQELIIDKVVVKEGKNYSLNMEWVKMLEKFSQGILEEYSSQKDHTNPELEVAYGHSTKQNPSKAGEEAAEEALEKIRFHQNDLQLALVFAGSCYEQDFSALLQGAKHVLGNTLLLGISTFGEIADNRFNESVTLILFAAKKENFQVETSFVEIKDHDNYDKYSSKLIKNVNLKNSNFAFIFFPGPCQENGMINIAPSFISSLSKHLPANLPLIGGVAADDGKLIKTYQFFNGSIYNKAVILATVKTNIKFAIAAEHGYSHFNPEKQYKFKLEQNTIKDISIQEKNKVLPFYSAAKVYAKEVGVSAEVLKEVMPYFAGPKGNFKQWIKLTAFANKSKPHILNYPFDIDRDGLIFTGYYSENEPMIMMDTNGDNLINSFKSVIIKAIEKLDDPQIIIAFPCAIYNVILATFQNEIKALKSEELFSNIPIAGAYVNGEIGPYDGKNIDFCNGSVVCLVLGKN